MSTITVLTWNIELSYGNAIDKPFLRHVASREIENIHGMKRRHVQAELKTTGSGVIVRYKTSVSHLLECIKIAFETHIKFLGEEYRDDTFYTLRQFLQSIIVGYDELRADFKMPTVTRTHDRRSVGRNWSGNNNF